MSLSVPVLSIVFILLDMLVGIAIPVGLLLYFKVKHKCSIASFFVGCGVMLVFALILEQLMHALILNSPIGVTIQSNTWLLCIYGGLMAGIFEETGRYIAFKTVLKKQTDNDYNALMYGAGHGGFEVFILLTFGMLNYLIYAILINTGNTEAITSSLSGDILTQTEQVLYGLTITPPANFLLSIVERIGAVIAHISFSAIVWFAAKNKKMFWLYPMAIFLHFFFDAFAVFLGKQGVNVIVIEGVIYVMAIVFAFFAYRIWKKEKHTGESK